jgi:hypothetical protein
MIRKQKETSDLRFRVAPAGTSEAIRPHPQLGPAGPCLAVRKSTLKNTEDPKMEA